MHRVLTDGALSPVVLGKGRAPGKAILFGEHAVVYGRPALAVPVTQVRAEAVIEASLAGPGLELVAADLGEEISLESASAQHPLALTARLTLAYLGLSQPIPWRAIVRSTIPIAGGLGSGAAVSAALARALADAAGQALSPEMLSAIVYQVEILHHGTPSGIDNSVVCYEKPIYFVRGQPPQAFLIGRGFMLAIAQTGVASPTREAVTDVRLAREREPERYDAIFDRIAGIVEQAKTAIEIGDPATLGPMMDENHALLSAIGVSNPTLEALAAAARHAGAAGAKLSGAGRGGNVIALVTADTQEEVCRALRAAGALDVIVTTVDKPRH